MSDAANDSLQPLHAHVAAGQIRETADLLRRQLDAGETVWALADLICLQGLLFHADTDLRQLAVRAIGAAGYLEAIPDLATLFAQGLDFYDHDYIFDAFRDMGESAVPALSNILAHEDEGERSAALQGLGLIGGAGVPVLITAVRAGLQGAASALFNARDPRAVPALLEAVARDSPEEAEEAAISLAECCDPTCTQAIEPLLALIRRASGDLRSELLQALGNIEDPRTIPVFARFVHSREPAAVEALAKLPGRAAVDPLLEAMRRPSRALQSAIVKAVLGHSAATSEERQEAARLAIALFESRPQQVGFTLEAVGEQPDCRVVVEHAAKMSGTFQQLAAALVLDSIECFREARRGPTVVRRRCAAVAWEFSGLTSDDLLVLAADPDIKVRIALADNLSMFDDALAISLFSVMTRDRRAAVRAKAAQDLHSAGPHAVELIQRLISDRSAIVRQQAAHSLYFLEQELGTEKWAALLARFLYDPHGRPVDPVIYVVSDEAEKEVVTVSSALARTQSPAAHRLLTAWKRSGGRRGWPASLDLWGYSSL